MADTKKEDITIKSASELAREAIVKENEVLQNLYQLNNSLKDRHISILDLSKDISIAYDRIMSNQKAINKLKEEIVEVIEKAISKRYYQAIKK